MCSWLLGQWRPLHDLIPTLLCSLHIPHIHLPVLPAWLNPARIRASGHSGASFSPSPTRRDTPPTHSIVIPSPPGLAEFNPRPSQQLPQSVPSHLWWERKTSDGHWLPVGPWACPELPHLQSFPGAGCSLPSVFGGPPPLSKVHSPFTHYPLREKKITCFPSSLMLCTQYHFHTQRGPEMVVDGFAASHAPPPQPTGVHIPSLSPVPSQGC